MSAVSLRIGTRRIPVILPRLGDPRLHLAAVIISIHVLGQVGLGFRVSVFQILAAIGACALIEMVGTFRRTGQIVWPASAMLTGSGVALILRIVGNQAGNPWQWSGWHLFAAVAGLSLLTKYLIRFRGSHIFNPSNVGLVVAFLVLGSDTIEPLDFWWGPFEGWVVAAYAIIVAGGVLITRRLGLLAMAATFWVVLAAGVGLVAASGHCITAAWALDPVCDADFWSVVVTSPEVLIFLFFMITDPKTIPVGRSARVAFAAAVALVSTVLLAPHTTEFGAKVGLLAGLAVMSPLRGLFDGALNPSRLILGGRPHGAPRLALFSRGAVLGSVAVLAGLGLVAAGAPARHIAAAAEAAPTPLTTVPFNPATLPPVTIDSEVAALNRDIGRQEAAEVAEALAENLLIEAEARRLSDPSLLRAADHGVRLVEMERRIEADAVAKRRSVDIYTFDTLHLRVVHPDGPQSGASLGFDATGTVEGVVYDAAGTEQQRKVETVEATFVLNQGSDGRWLLVEVQPSG